MGVETHERGNGTSVAVHSLDQPSLRHRSAVTIEAKAAQPQRPFLRPGGHRQ